jgi:hypothetical protein
MADLNLDGQFLGNERGARIVKALQDTPSITELSMVSTGLDLDDAYVICEALIVNSTLKFLDISSNEIGHQGAYHLSVALLTNGTLTNLNLSYTNIGNMGADHISSALKTNKSLKALRLRNNSISAEGILHIAVALKFNSTLTDIELSWNGFQDEGAKYLADAIKINKSISCIKMAGCVISQDGASYIADALMTNTSIKEISLACNIIGDAGAFHIARALKSKGCVIETLSISLCDIKSDGIIDISTALAQNDTLKSISLAGSDISKAVNPWLLGNNVMASLFNTERKVGLAEALSVNTSLTSINLNQCYIDDANFNSLAKSFESNTMLTNIETERNGDVILRVIARNKRLKKHRETTLAQMIIGIAFCRANKNNELKYMGLQSFVQCPILSMLSNVVPDVDFKQSAFSHSTYFKAQIS